MNEWSTTGGPISTSRDCHVPQVTPDHHQTSVRKMKLKITTATWNVRTMLQKEMKRMKINILGISEVRLQCTGKITSKTFKIFYAGDTEHKRGVAIILDLDMAKTVKGYWTVSEFYFYRLQENHWT